MHAGAGISTNSCAAHRASQHWCGMDWLAPARALARRTRATAITVALLLGTVEPGASLAAPPVGTVAGIAKDALERPVPGAQMRLESSDGQVVGRTTADDQGRFQFTGVAARDLCRGRRERGVRDVHLGGDGLGERRRDSGSDARVEAAARRGGAGQAARRSPHDHPAPPRRLHLRDHQPGHRRTSRADRTTVCPRCSCRRPASRRTPRTRGRIHVRNEHANVQYRINGVILPEGVSLFGTGGGLSPRFASKVDLITGALPAEYGLRTSGIIDIQTKNGAFDPGGYLGMYGGSFSWLQPSFEYGGSQGRLNYYGTGSYLQNSIGISPATPNGPIHDDTKQGFGFGYAEYVLDSTSKVSAIVGTFVGHFQIPNAPGRHARVHRQRHLRLRLHEGEREPARAELLRSPVVSQGRAGFHVPPLHLSPLQQSPLQSGPAGRSSLQRHLPAVLPQQYRGRAPGRGQLQDHRHQHRARGTDHLRRGHRAPDHLVRPADGGWRPELRHALQHLPEHPQDRLDLQRLRPGRVAHPAEPHHQRRAPVRRLPRLSRRMADQPASRRDLDADVHHDGPRGLCALLHASAPDLHADLDLRAHSPTPRRPRRSRRTRPSRPSEPTTSMSASSSRSSPAGRSASTATTSW